MTEEITWQTEITDVEPNKVVVRGYRLHDLIGKLPFSHVIYLLVRGELPSAGHGALLNAVLVAAVDHGAATPSAIAARTVATSGTPNMCAVAAGLMAIHRYHGGDINECMRLLYDAVTRKHENKKSAELVAKDIVQELSEAKARFSGYGDRFHTSDPRAARLLALTQQWTETQEYIEMAEAIRGAIMEASLRDLPLNLDGAIAVTLCEMGFPAELGNAVFAMSRMVGLTVHVHEEQTHMRPMRKVTYSAEYGGSPERDLESEEPVELLAAEEDEIASEGTDVSVTEEVGKAVTELEKEVDQAIQTATETARTAAEPAERPARAKKPIKSAQEIIDDIEKTVEEKIRGGREAEKNAEEKRDAD